MKVTRALLLSSMKQARAGEYEIYPTFFSFTGKGQKLIYSYLVTDCHGDGIVFEIYRVSRESYRDEQETERWRAKIADEPHVHQEFKDVDELIKFLQCNQIDVEDGWQPVEPA